MRNFYLKRIAILFFFSCVLFIAGNNFYSITDPDEAFYTLTAHEMTAHNEWMTPLIFGQPQFEKPPMIYWLLEIAFKIGGENPFTARLFPALFAVLGVLAVYWIGLMGFKDERKAFLSAMVLASSGFFVGMGKMVFTDTIFTVFILCAFTMFIWGFTDRRRQAVAWIGFYVFCALATLAKSPLGLVIPQVAVVLFLLYQRQISFLRNAWIPVGILFYMLIALPWFICMYQHYGHAFTYEYFYNDHWRRLISAEHRGNDHWFFYPFTMIGGVFPWSLFLVAAFIDLFKRLKSSVGLMDYLSLSWLLVVFFTFEGAHSKLASYILPLFPALALITGNFLGNAVVQIQQNRKIQILLYVTFLILGLMGIAVIGAHKVCLHYISSMLPLYYLSGALITLAGIGITLSLKEYYQEGLYVLALALVPLLSCAYMIHTEVESYASSHEASEYLPPRQWGEVTVLTSKYNARGIRYFTGQDVAVVDYSDKPFFSPHPIPILDTTKKINDILQNHPVTYAVVRKAAYSDLVKNFSGKYQIVLLRNIGLDYVMRIEALKHP